MITIYGPKETVFTHNGFGVVTAKEAIVTEELNGSYELSLTIANAEPANRQLKNLINFNIIKAPTPRGNQLFRIYQVKKNMTGQLHVNARHIFYDGLYNMVNTTGGSSSIDTAVKNIYLGAAQSSRFNASSNMQRIVNYEYKNSNVVNCFLGKGGLIEALGEGELLRDNFNISLQTNIGANRGFKVRYRKNLTGLDVEDNIQNIITMIKPLATSENGNDLYLPETYVISPTAGNYFMPIYGILGCKDIKAGKADYPTTAEAFTAMRQRAATFFANGGDKPLVNAKINFILLGDTLEYAEFKALEQIYLGDIVTTTYPELDFEMESKCIKYIYDALMERYISIELGTFRNDFAKGTSNNISSLQTEISGVDSMENRLAILESRMNDHTHKGNSDNTQRIYYNDLLGRP